MVATVLTAGTVHLEAPDIAKFTLRVTALHVSESNQRKILKLLSTLSSFHLGIHNYELVNIVVPLLHFLVADQHVSFYSFFSAV